MTYTLATVFVRLWTGRIEPVLLAVPDLAADASNPPPAPKP
jgi:hypothetical protein